MKQYPMSPLRPFYFLLFTFYFTPRPLTHAFVVACFNLFTLTFLLFTLTFSLTLPSCRQPARSSAESDLARFVNPFIGTGGHGHTYPGAATPFGMVQLSPDTRLDGWDGCSGYHFTDSIVYGFSHTHLSGTGVSDYGDILLMPYIGATLFHNGADGQPGYASAFDKNTEKASPGYYAVQLDKYSIGAELSATPRTGMHRYTYPAADTAGILLDLVHRDEVLDAALWVRNDHEIEGYRISRAWAEEQHVYFVARFSRPIAHYLFDGLPGAASDSLRGQSVKAAFRFAPSAEPLVVQVAISAVDMAGARNNLVAEDARHDFDAVSAEARNAWNRQLEKIRIKTRSDDESAIFYTALYHASLQPNLFTDADGRYRGLDRDIHQAEGYTHYTVFSLWDTYRAAHPLYNIIEPERSRDFVRTFLSQYAQSGELPVWELAGNETYCMIGYHAASVIADAWVKGIRDFDAHLALEAMTATANQDKFGKRHYREYGFVPAEEEAESVSKTLEYAYDDWCIAQMAHELEDQMTYEEFMRRAQSYQNLFDPETGFFRARRNQSWITPFVPAEVNYHFTEANAWQYGYYVPQDVEGWMELLGGRESAAQKLDALFEASSETTGRDQADITGLIGQYAHGNEPSHHIAYLYNFCGQPWKTQQRVQEIMATQYANAPDGLSGNEDCGQMSAWYIFSALGFYPVTPGSTDYIIGSPRVQAAEIMLADGKTFRISVKNGGPDSPYIQSVKLNGKDHAPSFLRHDDIIAGGVLEFNMGAKPNTEWGVRADDLPRSRIEGARSVPLPVVAQGKRAFFGQDTLILAHPMPDVEILYTTDGSPPDAAGLRYTQPIIIDSDTELRAVARHPQLGLSRAITTRFLRVPAERSIQLAHPYAPQYAASGPKALIDFLEGGNDYRTGEWQGFEGVDLDAIVDFGALQVFNRVGIRFLQDENSWIFMPERVTFYRSKDGVTYERIGERAATVRPEDKGTLIQDFSLSWNGRARYLRVQAHNRGVCPPGHKGAGGKAWIFADEIRAE
jgi:predicted alpha-1,2-mannosidase